MFRKLFKLFTLHCERQSIYCLLAYIECAANTITVRFSSPSGLAHVDALCLSTFFIDIQIIQIWTRRRTVAIMLEAIARLNRRYARLSSLLKVTYFLASLRNDSYSSSSAGESILLINAPHTGQAQAHLDTTTTRPYPVISGTVKFHGHNIVVTKSYYAISNTNYE